MNDYNKNLSEKSKKLTKKFYVQDAVTVAQQLLGKKLVRIFEDETQNFHKKIYEIIETEAYCGSADLACHASKGRTRRTEIMYAEGSRIYVYLIYGIYWMLNIVTGAIDEPQAVLLRGIRSDSGEKIIGSGKVGRELQIDKSFYGEDLLNSERIWICDAPEVIEFNALPRIGIDYAGEEWKNKPWRFTVE